MAQNVMTFVNPSAINLDMEKEILEQLRKDLEGCGLKQLKIAKQTGVDQGSLSRFMRGERGLSERNVAKLRAFLDRMQESSNSNTAVIRRLGEHSPVELIKGEGLPKIPVLGSAGAGNAVEFFNLEPDIRLEVLPPYALPDVVALKIEGNSMEPTIKKGSYVGVVPLNGKIIEGDIYLINLQYFGRVVKRVRIGEGGGIEIYSDNPDFPPQVFKEGENDFSIIGKVVWIWALC